MIPYSECAVNFSIINACSCKCQFCTFADQHLHQPVSEAKKLTLEEIQRTFRATPPGEKLNTIVLSGAGESIMHPECVEIAAFLKKQTEYLVLASNGVLLTPELSGKLIAAGVDEISVSITGVTPEVWGKYQGSGFGEKTAEVLQRVLSNIRGMCENRDRINPQCITSTRYILTDENKDHLLFYLEFMKDLGVSNVVIMPLNDISEEKSPRRYLVERTARRMLKGLPLCNGIGANMQTDIQEHPGDIPCCCHAPSLVVGNILEQPIYEILTGKKFEKLCNALVDGTEEIPQACLDCLYTTPSVSFWYGGEDIDE